MQDGPHNEGVSQTAPPTGKVVRLPRDWLGPREELVPLGRSPTSREAERRTPAPSGSPPSAEDFWGGGRAGAIHNFVPPPVAGVQEPVTGTTSRLAAHRFSLGYRRPAAAALIAIVVATATVVWSAGSGQRVPAGPRLDVAAILSSGISRILQTGSPRIISPNEVPRPHIHPVRRGLHRTSRLKLAPHAIAHQSTPPRPPPTYTARATTASASPSYHSTLSASTSRTDTSPPAASASRSSDQLVGPTGESGALGPVQSPNG